MRRKQILIGIGMTLLLAACATEAPKPDLDAMFKQLMASSFSDKGIAKVDRLQQDASDSACSQAAGAPLPDDQAQAIEAANLKAVRPPTDSQYLGSWQAGEKLAQNGKGMTWSDESTAPQENGGSCYNCHQIGPAEIAYGTLGPSLYQYGKRHKVSDPGSAAAQPVVIYTWAKIYNAKAYNACSTMPRFGHAGLLDEKQMKDVMALLLDPKSPVNQ